MDWSPIIAWGGFLAFFGLGWLFFKWYLRDQQPATAQHSPPAHIDQGERRDRSPIPHAGVEQLTTVEWLHIVTNEPDKAPHILIAGESGTGKTTIAQAMLTQRGGLVAIADPKPTRPGARKWGGLAYVSIDEDGGYRSIELLFQGLLDEVNQRLVEMRTSTKPFEPLTIVADEWLTLLAKCPSAAKLYELATIGRELGMRLIILSTSDQVKSLKLDGRGDLRENFRFLRLGDKAIVAQSICQGQHRPACLEWRGASLPIDVETVDALSRHLVSRVKVWAGVQGANSHMLNQLLDDAATADSAAHQPNTSARVRSDAPDNNAVRMSAAVIQHQENRSKPYTEEADAPAAPAPHESSVITPDELRRLVEAVKMVGAGESMTAALCKAFETKKGSDSAKWKRARFLWGLAQAEEVEA